MVRYFIFFILLILTYLSNQDKFILAQGKDSIKVKNKELEQIKKEITALEQELSNKSQKEKETLKFLENINRQNLLIKKLINNLIAEENQISQQIKNTEEKIAELENKISLLKEKYSRYIVWIYKNRGNSTLRFLLSSNSFNNMLKRYRYLKYISEQNEKDLRLLSENKNKLTELKNQLQQEIKQKEILVSQKLEEQNLLSAKQLQRRELIASLRKDKKNIIAEIESKRKSEIEIKNLIARLVEKERVEKARMLELANRQKSEKSTLTKIDESKGKANKSTAKSNNKLIEPIFNYDKLENFARLKGKMIWPVKNGRIVRKFGENKNEKLNTVTLNYGVDISTKNKQEIFAVAEGIVSAIEWIPGFGSVVIITHSGQYRTVYGHVTDITVKEGDIVKANFVIGKVNESLEGSILHFEIWNERTYQNPEIWLAKR